MSVARRITNALLVAVLAAGQVPLWVHEFTAHGKHAQAVSHSHEHGCSHCHFHKRPTPSGVESAGTDTPLAQWSAADDHDCAICYQLSQSSAAATLVTMTASAWQIESFAERSHAPSIQTLVSYPARGPPLV